MSIGTSMNSLTRPRWLVAVLVLLGSSATAAIIVVSASSQEAFVSGGTPEQEALVTTIAAGVDVVPISRIEIGTPPEGFEPNPALNEFGTTWLTINVEAPSLNASDSMIAQWAAQLIAGAFRDASHEQGMPDVLGSSVVYVLPDGSEHFGGGGVIATPFSQPIDASDDVALRRDLDARTQALRGLSKASISFQRPIRPAPVVAVTAGDAPTFLRSTPYLLQAVFGDLNRLEGSFLVVRDDTGAVVRVSGYATRTGMGVTWSAPGLPSEGGRLVDPR